MNTKYFKINLQLFADAVVNATTSATEGNNLSAEMKTFYDKTLIKEAQANLVHGQFGQKRPIPKNGGKTIEFRKFSSLPKALTPLTEGVTPVGNKLNVTTITATVAQYGDYVVQTDVLELTSVDNTIVEATRLLGNQAGLTIDTIHRNILNAGTNVSYAPSVAADGTKTEVTSRKNLTANSKMTADLVKRIVTKLKGVNAPKIDGYYVAIIHPHVAYDLMCDDEWLDVQKYATPENMLKGELGKIGGCRFVESTEAQIFTGDTCPSGLAVYSTLFLGSNAYGITEITGGGLQTIIKQKGSSGVADALDQRSSIGWKTMTTAEILVQEYMVRCESCSSFSNSATAN
jgi:N4-gp56 family major capsid protein